MVTNNSSIERTVDIELTIQEIVLEFDQSFLDKYRIVFTAALFTHLNIDHSGMSEEIFLKIMQLLPNLDTLRVSCLETYRRNSSNSRITKVYHASTFDLEQIDFLLHLCPYGWNISKFIFF